MGMVKAHCKTKRASDVFHVRHEKHKKTFCAVSNENIVSSMALFRILYVFLITFLKLKYVEVVCCSEMADENFGMISNRESTWTSEFCPILKKVL